MSESYDKQLKEFAERRQMVLDLYNSPMTASQISRTLGISRERVRQILNRCPDYVKRPPKRGHSPSNSSDG